MLAAFTAILAALYFSSILGLAAPNNGPSRLNVDRSRSRISQNEFQLDQVVTFQTVTNTETQIGTITESCQVTLTPINQSGVTLVRQDKKCKFTVTPLNGNNFNQNQNPFNTNTLLFGTATTSAFTTSETETSFTQAFTSNRVQVTPTLSPVANTRPPVAATTINNVQATNVFRAPDVSAIGISNVAAQTPVNGGLVTLGSLTNGAATSLPSAAAAQESPAAAQVPGRKLEVLPIGLGVFAGISVIALIVVGLVTYERTKYRKAFRQRKLAEAGANMGYGGMAERT